MKQIYFICLIWIGLGCSQNEKSTDSVTKSIVEDQIVFYSLTDHEFDSLVLLEPDDGLNESFSDFSFYASNVLDSMKNTDISTSVTTNRFIELGGKTIDKFDYTGFGIILIRNDSTYIESSVYTDIDYFMTITEFFNL
jgi:hypothetical protein